MGGRAVLLLEESGLKGVEDGSPPESGFTAEASVPGMRACCAKSADANKKIEQLSLQIISRLPTSNPMQIGCHCSPPSPERHKRSVFIEMPLSPSVGLVRSAL
jgi:hypothetical protein